MPNYDMSDTACRERAEREQRIVKLEKQVEELFTRMDTLLSIILNMNPDLKKKAEEWLKEEESKNA